MSFNDDEQIPGDLNAAAGNDDVFTVGKAKLKIINSAMAPVDESNLRVLLELTGLGIDKERLGLDLVTVLDVSGSMKGDRLEKLKKAMEFIIKKLSPIDRLSIITFGTEAHKVCGLRVVNEKSQVQIIDLVTQIKAEGWTNITDGLQTALKVLDGRTYKDGRSVGIMLMSDGEQNRGGDATQVEVGSVPVYTFGFGTATNARGDPKAMADVLNGIARKSNGGTFSDVPKTDGLSAAFAQCLGGLLTLAVQDLKLVISPENNTKVESVFAGDYAQTGNTDAEPAVTIAFGNLYDKEMRKIIVDLVLPKVDKEVTLQVLKIGYKYMNKTNTKVLKSPPIFASVKRIGRSTPVQREEVTVEASRIQTAQMMKESRILADQEKFDAAKNKIVDAQNLLEDIEIDGTNSLIEILKAELQQFLIFLQSPEMYKKSGRAYALSSELSHERQRHAAKGDAENTPAMFATPRMEAYKKQSESFEKGEPVPTAAEDAKEEALADPIGPISGALGLQIQIAIQALVSIQNILDSAAPR
ncbi:E3 ubiquitin-protein ligase WAVH1-like [Apium graveolens]|uniref:E3 ubiquitin-protein ligase WAVH1-like n=1 Tax=Apium graveolens TaxID=4045 RepID=UPI003D7AC21B